MTSFVPSTSSFHSAKPIQSKLSGAHPRLREWMIFLWAISRQYHKSSQLDCEIPNLGVQNRDGTERSLQSHHGSNGLNSEKGLNGEMRFWNKMGSIGQKIDVS